HPRSLVINFRFEVNRPKNRVSTLKVEQHFTKVERSEMETQKLINYTQQKLQQLLDFIFPPQCGGCKKGGFILCTSCIAQFKPIDPPFCRRCNSPLAPNGGCQRCHYRKPGLTGLRVAYVFQEPLRNCIHDFKYHGNVRLAVPLGLLLAKAY